MLEGFDYDNQYDQYEVTAYGEDRLGRHVAVFINMYPTSQSGPPYYWNTGRSGCVFKDLDEVKQAIAGATLSYEVKAVDKASLQVLQYRTRTKKETSFIAVLKDY
jgi:hypothetical protein